MASGPGATCPRVPFGYAFTDYRPDLGRGLEPRCASRREAAVIRSGPRRTRRAPVRTGALRRAERDRSVGLLGGAPADRGTGGVAVGVGPGDAALTRAPDRELQHDDEDADDHQDP